jgi:hypothetical protein
MVWVTKSPTLTKHLMCQSAAAAGRPALPFRAPADTRQEHSRPMMSQRNWWIFQRRRMLRPSGGAEIITKKHAASGAAHKTAHIIRIYCLLQCILRTARAPADTITI